MTQNLRTMILPIIALAAFAAPMTVAEASPAEARKQIITGYGDAARAATPGFTGFAAARGERLFLARPATGKPDTPSCTSCHTADPAAEGRTRAGKAIAPMAVSKTPDRYTDLAKVEKWFRRNCKSVLGRTCTALEKGDFLTFMSNR